LHLGDIHILSLVIGVIGILLMLGLRKWVPLLPGPIIVVALGTFLVWQLNWTAQGVEIVGTIPTGLPSFSLPGFSLGTIRSLFPTAVTLSLVQFMSVISLGKIFAARHRYTVDANRELIALGASNVLGGVFRSIPVSGSFSRSAVSEQAGGETAMVNVIAAALIALTLLFLTPLFYYLPIPVFASIIMVAAFKMIDVAEMRFLLRAKRIDGIIALVTFASTLILGIQEGVLVGVASSVVAIMYRISRPHVAELGHLPGTRSFRNLARRSRAQRLEGLYILRVDASFSFANADFLRDRILTHCQQNPDVKAVVLDASGMNDLDTTAAAVISEVSEYLDERGVGIYFAGLNGPALDVFRQSGLQESLGMDRFFLSPHRAVSHLLTAWGRSDEYLASVEEEEDHLPT
jgi:SulP family sulfate permease